MSNKKNKKGQKRQAANRMRKRRQNSRRPQRAGASRQGLIKKTGDMYHINSPSGLNSLLASGKPTLVDFWAPWCQPCLRMGPIFQRIAARYGGQINFAKVDTQALPKIGTHYGVQSIPTIIAFSGRKESRREVGLMNEQKMKRFAQSFLPEEDEEEEGEFEEQKEFESSLQQAPRSQLEHEAQEHAEKNLNFRELAAVATNTGKKFSRGGFAKRLRSLFGAGKK